MAKISNLEEVERSKTKHIVISLMMAVLAGVILYFLSKGLGIDQSTNPSVQINKSASSFSVTAIQGEEFIPNQVAGKFTLEDFKGKPLILNFWGSWCPSCKVEAKDLEKFWQTRKNQDIIILGVAFQDTVESASKFAKIYGKTYPLALDTESMVIDYGVTGAPETFVLNAEGKIVKRIVGPVTYDDLVKIEEEFFKAH